MSSRAYLTLDTPLIDYVTLTSFNVDILAEWRQQIRNQVSDGMTVRPAKMMQYAGEQVKTENGSLFVGVGEQRKARHMMVKISGELCEYFKFTIAAQVQGGDVSVRRLDIQGTIIEPAGWSQWGFLAACKERGITVGWVQSPDSNRTALLETVYMGARTSDRFARLYVKETAAGVRLLRFEVEFKGDRAEAVAKGIWRHGRRAGDYLRYEISKKKDLTLIAAFDFLLRGTSGATERLRVESSSAKTRAWLMGQVLPAYIRYINSHDADPIVKSSFGGSA